MTLFYFVLAWLAGIAIANGVDTPWWLWLTLIAPSLLGAVLARRSPAWRTVFGCVICLSLGAARLSASVPHFTQGDLAFYNDQGFVTAEGVIVTPPQVIDAFAGFQVEAEQVAPADGPRQQVHGLVLVQTAATQPFHYGDRVRLRGELKTPPEFEGFSYREVLARKGVHSLMSYTQVDVLGQGQGHPLLGFLFAFRADAHKMVRRLLPDPQASLLAGILLGIEDDISPEISSAFSLVGTTHVIVISGSNLVIVVGLIQSLTRRVMRARLSAAVTIAGVLFYTLFVGGDPAVTRAAIMVTLGLIGNQFGRQTFGMASLGAAALLMTLINPFTLWDVSFQLSFMATLGLILYVEPLQNLLTNSLLRVISAENTRQVTGFISDAFVVTIAAQITTTPIIALYFGRLSLLSLPANFLIIPVQTPLMVFGGLAVIVAFVSFPIGQIVAWASWIFLSWTIGVVRFFASLPYASMEMSYVSPLWVAGVYTLIFVSTWLFLQPGEAQPDRWKMLKQVLGIRTIAILGSLAAIILFAAAFSLPDGRLHVTFVDVDSGTAVLIVTPSGRHVLVDAGGSGRQISATMGDELPFWSRRLDLVILTRPDQAHTSGLPSVLGRYEPGAYLTNASLPQAALEAEPGVQRVPVAIAQPGTRVSVGDGVTLTVLYTDAASPEGDAPAESISLLLTYGDARILLPGDPTLEAITKLLNSSIPIQSTVLYLPQDRGEIASSKAFLTAASPQVVIIAVKDGKPLKPGDEEMLAFLETAGSIIYRTDQTGSVSISTEGKQLWLETAKGDR